jgi:hypothetical protein
MESGIQKFDNFTLFNSKSEKKWMQILCKRFLKYVKDFKTVIERIFYLRLKDK